MICKHCNGTGKAKTNFIPSYVLRRHGKERLLFNTYNNIAKEVVIKCGKCKGTGKISKIKEIIKLLKGE